MPPTTSDPPTSTPPVETTSAPPTTSEPPTSVAPTTTTPTSVAPTTTEHTSSSQSTPTSQKPSSTSNTSTNYSTVTQTDTTHTTASGGALDAGSGSDTTHTGAIVGGVVGGVVGLAVLIGLAIFLLKLRKRRRHSKAFSDKMFEPPANAPYSDGNLLDDEVRIEPYAMLSPTFGQGQVYADDGGYAAGGGGGGGYSQQQQLGQTQGGYTEPEFEHVPPASTNRANNDERRYSYNDYSETPYASATAALLSGTDDQSSARDEYNHQLAAESQQRAQRLSTMGGSGSGSAVGAGSSLARSASMASSVYSTPSPDDYTARNSASSNTPLFTDNALAVANDNRSSRQLAPATSAALSAAEAKYREASSNGGSMASSMAAELPPK